MLTLDMQQFPSLGVLMQVFDDGMMDIDAYGPFPNAILFNWATVFVLGFGNLAALDFQVSMCVWQCFRVALAHLTPVVSALA